MAVLADHPWSVLEPLLNQARPWAARPIRQFRRTRSESPGGGCSAVTRGPSFGAAGVIRWTHVVAPSRSGRPVP